MNTGEETKQIFISTTINVEGENICVKIHLVKK